MSKESALAHVNAPGPEVALNTVTTPGTETPNPSPNKVEEESKVDSQKDDLSSSRFAAIAKREAKLQKDREEFKAEQEKLRQMMTPFQEFEVLRSKDPVAAMKSLGFSDTDIFNFLSSNEKKELTPEEKAQQIAQAEIEKFKKEQEAKTTKEIEETNKRVVGNFRKNIKGHLEANKEKYKRCAQLGAYAETEVYRLVQQVLRDTNEIITIDEAYQMYEEFQRGEYDEMKKLYEPAAEPVVSEAATAPVSNVPKAKVVTNSATSTVASTVNRRESSQEKKERLINALRTGTYKAV